MEPKTFTPGYNLIKDLFEEFGTGSITWDDRIQLLKTGKRPLKSRNVNKLVFEIFTEIKEGIEGESGPTRDQALGKVAKILQELSKVDHSVRNELVRINSLKEKKEQEDALLNLFIHADVIRLCGRMFQKMFPEGVPLTKDQMKEKILSRYHNDFASDSGLVAQQAAYQGASRLGKMFFMIIMQIAELIALEAGIKPPSADYDESDAPKVDPKKFQFLPPPPAPPARP